jgi:hypothetical protein
MTEIDAITKEEEDAITKEEEDEWEFSFRRISLQVKIFSEFLFTSLILHYSWIRQHNRWTQDQRELNKIIDYPEKNKEIIDSFKTIFNELIMFCSKT